ncbi:MAG: chemotaxis protein CheD [Fimbriimonas sp.]
MALAASPTLVGMAELHVLRNGGQLACLGLGSCIGLCMFDPEIQVGGMVHVMLPEAYPGKPVDKPGKFADTGVLQLLRLMERAGANRNRIVVAYAGGAQVFSFGNGESRLDIGARNAVAVQAQLQALGMRPRALDVGGNLGRTVTFALDTGQIRVRTVSQGERLLCTLKD